MRELRRPRFELPQFLFVQVSGVDGISAPAGSRPCHPTDSGGRGWAASQRSCPEGSGGG